MAQYETLQDGARALLVDVVNGVRETRQDFVIVGGWSPLLLNAGEIPHPGTIDVDVLFAEGATANALRSVVEHLLESGFHPSAKHHFQLLKAIDVRGQPFLYNVDLLHPSEAVSGKPSKGDLFVEHIALDVPMNAIRVDKYRGVSIAAPHSGFIFEEGRIVVTPVDAASLDGTTAHADVPVMDELGLLVTKSLSVKMAKRPRDAFDIYMAAAHARDRASLIASARSLEDSKQLGAFLALGHLWSALEDEHFDIRVNDYMPPERQLEFDQLIESRPFSTAVWQVLEEAGVPAPSSTD